METDSRSHFGPLSESIRTVTCRADSGIALRATARIGGARGSVIRNVPEPTSFAPSGMPVDSAKLQKFGGIRYVRGQITVLDRPKLEKLCCECYAWRPTSTGERSAAVLIVSE